MYRGVQRAVDGLEAGCRLLPGIEFQTFKVRSVSKYEPKAGTY